jgi:hypothetical protein
MRPTRVGVGGAQGGAEGGELGPELTHAAVGRPAALPDRVADHACRCCGVGEPMDGSIGSVCTYLLLLRLIPHSTESMTHTR